MKTSYYLVAGAVLTAAAVTTYAQLPPIPTAPPGVPLLPALPAVSSPPDVSIPLLAVDPYPVAPPPRPSSKLKIPQAAVEVPRAEALVPPTAPGPKPLPLPELDVKPSAQPLPAPTLEKPKGPARYAVTADGKLIEGVVTTSGDKVIVRRGALDQTYTKDQVKFTGHTKDEVREYLVGTIDKADAAARLKVARWCLFNGMRSQALAEAREVKKLQPENATAAEMIRSLEESLKKFPEEGPSAVVPASAEVPVIPAAKEPEPDVTADAAAAFTSKVQPLLANLCADCHARPTHDGAFKLARTTSYDYSAATARQNLLAVAGQLKKADPGASPLLAKALAAHGGQKEPAIQSRQHAAYRNLEAWVAAAVPAAAAQAEPRTLPQTVTQPATPVPPAQSGVVAAGGFGAEVMVEPPTGPNPANTGAAVDEFDPSVFNRVVHPGKK